MPLEATVEEGDERWDEIANGVIKIVADRFGKEENEISYTMRFNEDLQADSLENLDMIMRLEDRYEITISDEEAEKIKTVRNAVDYIHKTKYQN